jgi:hypothetical protein
MRRDYPRISMPSYYLPVAGLVITIAVVTVLLLAWR